MRTAAVTAKYLMLGSIISRGGGGDVIISSAQTRTEYFIHKLINYDTNLKIYFNIGITVRELIWNPVLI